MITRFVPIVLGMFSGVILLAILLWYLAFPAGPGVPEAALLPSLAAGARIEWSTVGPVRIESKSESDVWTALGFVHGHRRTWQVLLWRQAALGRLYEWFGPDAAPIDRLVMRLGIPGSSRRAYEALSGADRQAIQSYADGLNNALGDESVGRSGPLLLLGVEIAPWEAWHGVAIEHLLSWVSLPAVSAPEGSEPSSAMAEMAHADSLLRDLLHVFGFESNAAALISPGSPNSRSARAPYLAGRYVTGNSGLPFFLEADVKYGDNHCTLLSVPGTPIVPMGTCEGYAWARMMKGVAHLNVLEELGAISVSHARIRVQNSESIIEIPRVASGLPLPFDDGSGGLVLAWDGLDASTDLPAWTGLLAGKPANLQLFADDGIDIGALASTAAAEGAPIERVPIGYVIRGAPASVFPFSRGLFVSNTPIQSTPAERLADLSDDPDALSAEHLLSDLVSPRAAAGVPALLARVPDSVAVPARLQEALTYLRNWNFRYDSNEIGASLFDLLQTELSGREDGANVLTALSGVVSMLENRLGADMRTWRWETVQERRVYFPGWTSAEPDAGRPETVFKERYRPLRIPGPGHPDTFVWGGHASSGARRATSAWEGAFQLDPSRMLLRRVNVDYEALLGQSLAERRPVQLEEWTSGAGHRTTILEPEVR